MTKKFQLIVFDWDGTLFDSTLLITQSLQAAAVAIGVPPPSDARASHVIGLGLIDALRYAMPDLEEARYRELAEHYRDHYLARDTDCWTNSSTPVTCWRWRLASHAAVLTALLPQAAWVRNFTPHAVPMNVTPSRTRKCSKNCAMNSPCRHLPF